MNGGLNLHTNPGKILIIKPSSLGDIIHGLPVLNALRMRFPEAELHWVVAKGFHGILEEHPMIHRLWIIDKNAWKKPGKIFQTVSDLKELAAGLRKERFDLVVDLQGLFRSALIGLFTGARERVGFESAREGAKYTYKFRVKTDPELHAVDKNMLIARFLGCETSEPTFPLPPLDPSPAVLRNMGAYAAIAPFAGTQVKTWALENFAELASMLPIPSVIVGGKADRERGDRIALLSNGRAFSLAGRITLKELAAIIKHAKFVVCPDTGPMHIAAALNVPVFAIFGPTSPARTGPYGNIHTIIRSGAICSPCYKRKPCPDWRCMHDIKPEMVLGIIQKSRCC
jgi:lipopolysaccharide heptosyltransferase I